MRQPNSNICFLVFITVSLMIGCNQSESTSEKTDAAATPAIAKIDSPAMPPYDPALEPLTVGAQYAKLLHDTLNVKFYEFTMKPGDSAALHAHPDHIVYVLQGGKLSISMNGGTPQVMELKAGMGFISPALTDAGKNIGTTTIKMLVADIYRPRVK